MKNDIGRFEEVRSSSHSQMDSVSSLIHESGSRILETGTKMGVTDIAGGGVVCTVCSGGVT